MGGYLGGLRKNSRDEEIISEEDYLNKEEKLSQVHMELKNRSIEILTD